MPRLVSAPRVRASSTPVGKHIELTGVVQGVGFRPFVYNLAVAHALAGWVRNTSGCVQIEVQGGAEQVDAFLAKLVSQAPPLARIESMSVQDIAPYGNSEFAILESLPEANAYQLVSPDIATCPDCQRELFDPDDRRYGYPFINCTNCGPRFTIIQDIPYDRSMTTMNKFVMCPSCLAEYKDPTDRRFHAQPNACPVCGPHLSFIAMGDETPGSSVKPNHTATSAAKKGDAQALHDAATVLQGGRILALKGLGGFHLACDATNQAAVRELRARKHRPHKPFALMMRTLEEVGEHCWVSPEEAALLTSPAHPIVLSLWRDRSSVVRDVAPNNRYLGVMLPYTPLHHLLLQEVGRPLVMTSGNLSEEPIAMENHEALHRLGSLADAFLLHDRDIYSRYDDSVWFIPLASHPQSIRRARGYAPQPARLSFPLKPILACGAELKNTFCLTQDRYAFVSQHIGDMENVETLEHFEATVKLYERLFRVKPVALACDLHPDYLATRYGRERAENESLPLFPIQHHHAHVASCLADNDWPLTAGPVIGVAMDGTGLGDDGQIWGGEFLVGDYRSYERMGHLEYLPLPGGDTATRKPYRIALAYLYHLLGHTPPLPFLSSVSPQERELVHQMVRRRVHTPLTSSCGRLFDAISALLNVCLETSYEAQAAIELEMVAAEAQASKRVYPFLIEPSAGQNVIRLHPLLEAVSRDVQNGGNHTDISATFHHTVAKMIVQMCMLIRQERQIETVALSGGCFQNRLLLRLTTQALEARNFRVLLHHQVPCNDGGLSLGQAIIAHVRYRGGE